MYVNKLSIIEQPKLINFVSMENQNVINVNQPSSDEKTMAILAHILTIVGGFIAPLVIYLVKKDESEYVAKHSNESLNFQITMFIAYIVSAILCIIFIGFLLLGILGLVNLILVIMATIKASEGADYEYPFNLRLIK